MDTFNLIEHRLNILKEFHFFPPVASLTVEPYSLDLLISNTPVLDDSYSFSFQESRLSFSLSVMGVDYQRRPTGLQEEIRVH